LGAERVFTSPYGITAPVFALARDDEKISSAIEGKTVIKEIVVPGKIINIVVK
jgi:leucyl-tRNA synthetase